MMKFNGEDENRCPSFNFYSSDRLAETALQVAAENKGNNGEDDEFEFAFVRQGEEIAGEESLYGGRSVPVLPVFDKDLLSTNRENERLESSVTLPMSKLSIGNRKEEEEEEEGDYAPSCSSSEADELENLPAVRYCVWRWKKVETPSPGRCKKSKSTGSTTRRCKLRGFLRRSNSEGKGNFIFLAPKHQEGKIPAKSTGAPKRITRGKVAGAPPPASPSAHEALYLRNRAAKESQQKKSYLPYRQDLLGIFANVNGVSKTFPHF